VQVQILLNAMNANTAAIGQGLCRRRDSELESDGGAGQYSRENFRSIASNPATLARQRNSASGVSV